MTDAPRQRDELGRWLPGVSGNRNGRKSLAAELPFIEGIKQGASADTVAKIIEMLGKYALDKKSLQAAALYLQYTVPLPAKTVINQSGALGEIEDDEAAQIVRDAADFLQANDDRSA